MMDVSGSMRTVSSALALNKLGLRPASETEARASAPEGVASAKGTPCIFLLID
jgi:hypothetical protein